jgi:hypothetical protein
MTLVYKQTKYELNRWEMCKHPEVFHHGICKVVEINNNVQKQKKNS